MLSGSFTPVSLPPGYPGGRRPRRRSAEVVVGRSSEHDRLVSGKSLSSSSAGLGGDARRCLARGSVLLLRHHLLVSRPGHGFIRGGTPCKSSRSGASRRASSTAHSPTTDRCVISRASLRCIRRTRGGSSLSLSLAPPPCFPPDGRLRSRCVRGCCWPRLPGDHPRRNNVSSGRPSRPGSVLMTVFAAA